MQTGRKPQYDKIMRWRDESITTLGETREIIKFSLFPITIGKETRWLELSKIHQEYKTDGCGGGYWANMNFSN